MSFLKVFVFLLLAFGISSAQVNNYYVSTSGSNSNDGSQAHPWQTIQHADSALNLGATGTVIHFAPGSYGSGGVISTRAEGAASQRITWISDTPLAAIVNGDWIIGNNGNARGGDYNTIQGFTITSPNTDEGIQLGSGGSSYPAGSGGGNFVWILGNYIHDIGTYGSTSGPCSHDGAIGQSGLTHDALIDGNRINRAGTYGGCQGGTSDHGIYLGGYRNTVTNNVVSNVAGAGIQQYHNSCENVIANNTVFHNFTGGINVGNPADSIAPCGTTIGSNDYGSITNNLVVRNGWGYATSTHGSYAIGYSTGTGTHNKAFNNLMAGNFDGSGNVTTSSNDIGLLNGNTVLPTRSGNLRLTTVSGIFVNYQDDGSGNYNLASASPAIGAGTSNSLACTGSPGFSAPCTPAKDYSGTLVTNPPQIGAFTFGSSGSLPSPPSGLGVVVN